MILVDSSVWVDYFRGKTTPETDKLDLLLGHEAFVSGRDSGGQIRICVPEYFDLHTLSSLLGQFSTRLRS